MYTPPGYETSRARYPVLYLLHGWGGDEDEWSSYGQTATIMDNLIATGKTKPMIVVMPNGHTTQAAARNILFASTTPKASLMTELSLPYALFPNSLLNDVIPFVEKTYRVIPDRKHRAIAGLSMGGALAAFTGLNNVDRFAWVASFSGALVLWPNAMVRTTLPPGSERHGLGAGQGLNMIAVAEDFPLLDEEVNSQLRLLYISVGMDDGLIDANREFKEWLKSKNIEFVDVETPGYAHVWSLWRKNLADVAPRLFQPAPNHSKLACGGIV